MEEDEELEKIRSKKLMDLAQKKEGKSGHTLTGTPVEVTDSNFNEVVKRSSLVAIDCWAAWCAPCRMIDPIIEELAKDYAGKVLFGKLNVDESRTVALEYKIMSIPTVLVFKDGNLVDQIIGAMPRKLLEPRIIRHL
jgi:thioredoxin 1